MMKFLSYGLIRVFTFPCRFLSYRQIQGLGIFFGSVAYYLIPKFRKKTLSNLVLAPALGLKSSEAKPLAKQAMQHLMITSLEYAKLDSDKNVHRVIRADNYEKAVELSKEGKGLILFCGHLANWELLFLDATHRMPGIAIGRPIKNPYLYRWIVSIREKCGGKIVPPQNAIKEGLRALKKGLFLGIVGDQGMPDSGFKSPFLGREAWTSPLPALLSYRTGRPIVVLTMERKPGYYTIHYSDPIWPNVEGNSEEEISRLMKETLGELEQGILRAPAQWLWPHNRWKQQLPGRLKRRFRHDSILIILPEEEEKFQELVGVLRIFRELYPTEYLCIKVPKRWENVSLGMEGVMESYAELEELYVEDFRFKLVFNFTGDAKLKKHYLRQAAFMVVGYEDLELPERSLAERIEKTLTQE